MRHQGEWKAVSTAGAGLPNQVADTASKLSLSERLRQNGCEASFFHKLPQAADIRCAGRGNNGQVQIGGTDSLAHLAKREPRIMNTLRRRHTSQRVRAYLFAIHSAHHHIQEHHTEWLAIIHSCFKDADRVTTLSDDCAIDLQALQVPLHQLS